MWTKKYFLKKDHDSQVTAAAQNFVRKKLMLKGAIQAFLTLFDLNNEGFFKVIGHPEEWRTPKSNFESQSN